MRPGAVWGPGILFSLILLFLPVLPISADDNYKGYERGEALITPAELKNLKARENEDLVILAVAKPMLEYRVGHIPGALNVWRPMYEPEVGNPWPYDGMLLNRENFQEFARDLGINNDSTVVVYDHKYDATRLWWAFYRYGKKDVRVLDGGYDAWVEKGYDVNRAFEEETSGQGNFVAQEPGNTLSAELGDLWRAKSSERWHAWDTRSEVEWTGEEVKGSATCGGRVPWAEKLNWSLFKTKVSEDSKEPTAFLPASNVQKKLKEHGVSRGEHHIFYCQSGVRCTTDLFVLYLLGYDPAYLHNYDGSWLEWSYHYCDDEVNERTTKRSAQIENESNPGEPSNGSWYEWWRK